MPQTQPITPSVPVGHSNQETPIQDQLRPQTNRLQLPSRFSDARFHTRHLRRWHRLKQSKHLLACRQIFSFVAGCLQEIRSLVRRIELLRKRRYDLRGVDLGEFFEKTSGGTYQANRHTHSCSVDIERLSASRPWLTAIDVALAAEAWSMGVEWCSHTHTQPSVQTFSS
jgi:hypothetical protein